MAGTNDILEVAKTTMNASTKCNTVRGYIGWHSCNNICMDMYDVLDMCENAFRQGRFLDVLEVATYVLVSGVKLASYADSSSGMLTDVIMCTFELIGVCTQTIAKEDMGMRTKAFSLIIKDALNEKQYQEAERLCFEQIKDDDWRYYKNDPDDWNNILFDVFVQAGQIDKQVDQAKKILFLGNEEFWDVLKKLYQSQNAWETQRPKTV